MKLLLSWLREYVDVDLPVPELARRLIDATAEVESWETIGADWDPERIRVAQVVAVEPHPNADRLRLATVETGAGRQQVVCGAPNVAVGQKVAFATEGALLVDGHTGEKAKLKLRPIRGVESAGMVLSEKELGLSDSHEGILVLPDDAVIGRPLVEQLGDVLFDISTWANRADLLGVLGLAREVSALVSRPLREPATSYSEGGPAIDSLASIVIQDPDLCPRFTASVIQGVTIGPSPAWMQERLLRHGMRPINNVVDITNYVMIETGQPLHAFDYDLVRGKTLIARRATPGEKLVTLDGVEREFDGQMVLVCDGEGAVSVAGVMGGGNSEVSERTTNVLLEVATWVPGNIRRTSMYLKLRSEASLRFEKGLGPEMAEFAHRRALHLFEQLTGGTISKGIIDVYPGKQPPRTIILPAARIEQVLGFAIATDDVRRIFTDLGFLCHHLPPDRYSVQPPYWRPDVLIADDLIEDLARIHGYDKLPATKLRGSLPEPEPRPVEDLRERVRDLAVGLGFQEIITYSLTEKQKLERVVAPEDVRRRAPLSVVNPVAARHTYLRTSLRAGLLETYAANPASPIPRCQSSTEAKHGAAAGPRAGMSSRKAPKTAANKGPSSMGRQLEITPRPRGRTTRCSSARPLDRASKSMMPNIENPASKRPSSKGRAVPSPILGSTDSVVMHLSRAAMKMRRALHLPDADSGRPAHPQPHWQVSPRCQVRSAS